MIKYFGDTTELFMRVYASVKKVWRTDSLIYMQCRTNDIRIPMYNGVAPCQIWRTNIAVIALLLLHYKSGGTFCREKSYKRLKLVRVLPP